MDLEDLVNSPRETLSIELKEWIDLNDKVAQAKLAKHIAALCNFGGGYIVFGFCDDESVALDRPGDISGYNRDNFGQIANKYLTPPLQCEVVQVQSAAGLIHPVVRVPSHKATPICAKADGPHDAKGRSQGINAGTYYTRKVGPKSEAIRGAEDWQPLIRRCVSFDRNALLAEIASVMQTTQLAKPQQTAADKLMHWHDASATLWRDETKSAGNRWPVSLEDNHVQLSYLITSEDDVIIPDGELRNALEQANHSVKETVWTGWSMFYPFSPPEIAPAFHAEHEDGTGPNVLVSNLLNDSGFDTGLPDYWRYSVDGRASILRPFREDRLNTVNGTNKAAGTWLSPETVIRETSELVAHAWTMAERYGGESVSFRCKWYGLKGRKIDDFGGVYWSPGRVCQANQRTTIGAWELTTLKANWHAVVAELSCPILSLFGFTDCSVEMVERMAPRFIKL